MRQGGQAAEAPQAAQCCHRGDGGQRHDSQRRVGDCICEDLCYVGREIEQFPADQPLEGLHRILSQLHREILKVLKEFEGSSDPE